MVGASPALAALIHHWRASDTLSIEATRSKFVPLGADADTMDGLNIHGAIIDELHAHRDRAPWWMCWTRRRGPDGSR